MSSAVRGGLVLRTRPSRLSIIGGVLLALVAWEGAARVIQAAAEQGDRVVPSLTTVATDGFIGLSNYWSGGWGVDSTASGGEAGVTGAVLALLVNAGITIGRVTVGLVVAIVLGVAAGLLVASVRPIRLSVSGIAEVMRMLPALAMAPLFTLWFGPTTQASIVFVVFGVAFIVLVGTVNAVQNLPAPVIEYPRTLGVRGARLWTRVVLPATLPELRGSLVFAGLVAWTTVLASEMYGMQSGLGWMLSDTLRFSLVDRMVVVAVVFSGLALITMKVLGYAVTAATRWSD